MILLGFWKKILHRKTTKSATPATFSTLGRNTLVDLDALIENVPIRWLQQGRTSDRDVRAATRYQFSPRVIEKRVRESDQALAATTPILGQYAPTFGWPDDS